MTWFYVDDHLHDHRKARRAGLEAMGLWTLAGSWCADNLTDGFVPADVVWRWTGGMEAAELLAKQLVAAGLWHEDEEDGDRGWRFHDWSDVQKTREQVLSQREKRAEAGRKGGIRSGASRRATSPPDASPSPGGEAPTRATAEDPAEAFAQASAEASASALLEAQLNPVPSRPVPNPSAPTERAAEPPHRPTSAELEDSGGKLVARWIEASAPGRPPGRLIGQLGKELKAMLAEGIPYADVEAGLDAWHAKGLHPSAVASVVHELRTAHARRSTPPRQPRSTADRMASVQALKRGPATNPAQLALGG